MKSKTRAFLLATALAPTAALAQHFSEAYVDIRLWPRDSITVTVEADAQDMMNTVFVFPLYADTGIQAYRRYELSMEQYLQQKIRLRADAKPIFLKAVAWKKGGKGREDGLDTGSIQTENHVFTMGGKIPARTKRISIISDMWNERSEIDRPPVMEYFLYEGEAVRRRFSAPTERWVNFPVAPDSLAKMSRHPPHIPPRDSESRDAESHEEDHSGHNH